MFFFINSSQALSLIYVGLGFPIHLFLKTLPQYQKENNKYIWHKQIRLLRLAYKTTKLE